MARSSSPLIASVIREAEAVAQRYKEIAELVLDADELIAQIGPEAAGIILASASQEVQRQLAEKPPEPPE